MPLHSFTDLYQAADQLQTPVAVVATGGADSTVLEALANAQDRGWVDPILTGDERAIRQQAEEMGLATDRFEIVSTEVPAVAAVSVIRSGRASVLMKGQVSTPDMMLAMRDREAGRRTGRTICQIVLMEITPHGKSFLLTDTGVTIAPSLEQKVEFVEAVASIAHSLGADQPRVALMAATEKPMEAMPDSLEAAELTERSRSGWLPNAIVEGPLSFDLAYAAVASARKSLSGRIAGEADGMVFPDLRSAYLTVKAIMYTADCQYGGILWGAACPVVFMSRADNMQTRMNSIAYALHARHALPH